jgi:hypothetical protein
MKRLRATAESVGTLRGRRRPEKHTRLQVTQQARVSLGLFTGVVELVDDHHFEAIAGELSLEIDLPVLF